MFSMQVIYLGTSVLPSVLTVNEQVQQSEMRIWVVSPSKQPAPALEGEGI